MNVRDTVLLLVSVGQFGCFGYRAASRQECSVFERSLVSIPVLSDTYIVLPTRVLGSLREFHFVTIPVYTYEPPVVKRVPVQALFEGPVFFSPRRLSQTFGEHFVSKIVL
ncbi:hypothetical protein AnigIFM63309_000428 [Aspergillus niger]|nr:hypothetical protein AnigIFM63309_000428 [Aspergillus niger]